MVSFQRKWCLPSYISWTIKILHGQIMRINTSVSAVGKLRDHHLAWSTVINTPRLQQLKVKGWLRACSHEPGTVNYPGVMSARGQELPRVHMMIRCPGVTLPRVNFIAPGKFNRHLITTNVSEFLYFLHKLLQRMNFIHVYVFLVHFGTSYWEIYSKH